MSDGWRVNSFGSVLFFIYFYGKSYFATLTGHEQFIAAL